MHLCLDSFCAALTLGRIFSENPGKFARIPPPYTPEYSATPYSLLES